MSSYAMQFTDISKRIKKSTEQTETLCIVQSTYLYCNYKIVAFKSTTWAASMVTIDQCVRVLTLTLWMSNLLYNISKYCHSSE